MDADVADEDEGCPDGMLNDSWGAAAGGGRDGLSTRGALGAMFACCGARAAGKNGLPFGWEV